MQNDFEAKFYFVCKDRGIKKCLDMKKMETHFSCQLFGKSEQNVLFPLKTGL